MTSRSKPKKDLEQTLARIIREDVLARRKPRTKEPRTWGIFWAVVDESDAWPMPCLAGPKKRDARRLQDKGERIVRIVVTEYQP